MNIQLYFNNELYFVDLNRPHDISIPLLSGNNNPSAWHAPTVSFTPVISGDFIGDIEKGSPVNFFNVTLNPHGNGTHTESMKHISSKGQTINQSLRQFHFIAQLISIAPEQTGNDLVITKRILPHISINAKALIIRTLPNTNEKLTKSYSGKNPPYISVGAMQEIVRAGIEHLLIDLPSVDKEKDDGLVASHKVFWDINNVPRKQATITEMVFINNDIQDGLYLLNIQVPSFELDAAPSKPVIYKMVKTGK
jgi:arylformamidase